MRQNVVNDYKAVLSSIELSAKYNLHVKNIPRIISNQKIRKTVIRKMRSEIPQCTTNA